MAAAPATGDARGLDSGGQGLKARLLQDASYRAYGAFLETACPLVAELMGRCGYGFLVVDMEHSPAGIHAALPMLQAVAATGRSALLRVPLNKPELIKKALDLGPEGLVIPLVSSEEEARAAVAACRYPPRGIRGVAHPLVRASGWGLDRSYGAEAEARHLLLCMLETPAAVEAVDAILDVDGVDGIFVGPMDLSAALGHFGQPGHPDVAQALARVEAAAARHPGKVLAGFSGGRLPADMFAAGYRLVAGAVDVTLLRDAACADVAAVVPALEAPVAEGLPHVGGATTAPGAKRLRC